MCKKQDFTAKKYTLSQLFKPVPLQLYASYPHFTDFGNVFDKFQAGNVCFFTQIEVYAQSYPHFHTLVCITCLNIHMNYFSLLPQCIKPLSLIKPTEQKHCSAVPLLLVLADKLPNFNVVY